jgi:hypothetical protein
MRHSLIRKLTAAAVAVAILATSTAAMAQQSRRLPAGFTHTWQIEVFAGVPVNITVEGDGDSRADLDLYGRDQLGTLVMVDDDYTDFCIGRWRPSRSGVLTIRIVNVGTVYNDYVLHVTGGYIR